MHAIGISLSDAGITASLFDGRDVSLIPLGRHFVASPACAFRGEGGILFGEEALARSRLSPGRSNDRYLDQLSLQPAAMNQAGQKPVSHAHLTYLHLQKVWNRIRAVQDPVDRVGLALPGNAFLTEAAQEERLGILLGIAADLGLPVSVLVPMEIAGLYFDAPAVLAQAAVIYQVDIHLHRTEIARIEGAEEMSSVTLDRIPDFGFRAILENLSHRLAQRFLQETAFDVFDDPEVEQEFFLRARSLLLNPPAPGGHREITLAHANKPRRMQIAEDTLEGLLGESLRRIAERVARVLQQETSLAAGAPVAIQLTGRAGSLPGLGGAILRASPRPAVLVPSERGTASAGAAILASRHGRVADLQQTPVVATWKRPAALEAALVPAGAETRRPTHLLVGSTAYPLAACGWLAGQPTRPETILPPQVLATFRLPWKGDPDKVTPPAGLPVRLNGRALHGSLHPQSGDLLDLEGVAQPLELRFIREAGPAGAKG